MDYYISNLIYLYVSAWFLAEYCLGIPVMSCCDFITSLKAFFKIFGYHLRISDVTKLCFLHSSRSFDEHLQSVGAVPQVCHTEHAGGMRGVLVL